MLPLPGVQLLTPSVPLGQLEIRILILLIYPASRVALTSLNLTPHELVLSALVGKGATIARNWRNRLAVAVYAVDAAVIVALQLTPAVCCL